MQILITGGAGYIGSHTCVELLEAGHDIVVIDNFCNSRPEALNRIEEITGKSFPFHQVDLLDQRGLEHVFERYGIEAVIHFAGWKAVGESVDRPLQYYTNNVAGTLALCEAMERFGVRRMVFSSSATVYGKPEHVPIREDAPLGAVNPYGRTKRMIEDILCDLHASNPDWSIALLRYFNPIGAHKSGRIGEDPNGIPNNLMPYITQVAVGKLRELQVFGNDYPTHDGTGVRDYIHVVDLAEGHLKALERLMTTTGVEAFNLGTGRGYSVLELIGTFQRATGKTVPYRIVHRRPGDAAICYADPAKANEKLGWAAVRGLREMCEDAWRWQSENPHGYEAASAEQARIY